MSGVSYGLSLELNIEPSDYLKGGQVIHKTKSTWLELK